MTSDDGSRLQDVGAMLTSEALHRAFFAGRSRDGMGLEPAAAHGAWLEFRQLPDAGSPEMSGNC